MKDKTTDILITVFKEKGQHYYITIDSIARCTQGIPYRVITTVGMGSCAENRNIGLKKSSAPYICIVDDDIIVTEKWLEDLHAIMEKTHADVVVPKFIDTSTGLISSEDVVLMTEHPCSARMRGHMTPEHGYEDILPYVFGGGAGFMLMKREVFDRLGYYDEQFKPNQYEDVDYFHRINLAGFKIVYTPEVILFHSKLGRQQKANPLGDASLINWVKISEKWDYNIEDTSKIRMEWQQ